MEFRCKECLEYFDEKLNYHNSELCKECYEYLQETKCCKTFKEAMKCQNPNCRLRLILIHNIRIALENETKKFAVLFFGYFLTTYIFILSYSIESINKGIRNDN